MGGSVQTRKMFLENAFNHKVGAIAQKRKTAFIRKSACKFQGITRVKISNKKWEEKRRELNFETKFAKH